MDTLRKWSGNTCVLAAQSAPSQIRLFAFTIWVIIFITLAILTVVWCARNLTFSDPVIAFFFFIFYLFYVNYIYLLYPDANETCQF